MKRLAVLALAVFPAAAGAPQDLPRQWIDPATHHRIVRISDEPGSIGLYFNFNAYTPQNDEMVIQTPSGIASVDLKRFALRTVVSGKVHLLFTGHKTRSVYYETGGSQSDAVKTIYAADIDTGKTRVVARIASGTIQTINADETLLAGVEEFANGAPVGRDGLIASSATLSKGARMKARLEAKIPMEIFTVDLVTGARKSVIRATDWLNHLQFSPSDPGLLMYCHEGPWHAVDRIWLIRTDKPGAVPVKVHSRSMNMEIAGHEWFSHDGTTVWYDLQTPRGEDFWVAGYRIADGRRTWYHLARDEWSVHYNSSNDGTLFSGDGGDAQMVAHAPDGKWLYLFRPKLLPEADSAGAKAQDSDALIHPGTFEAEKLVDMQNHDYQKLEPDARFSPDGKWLFFRSNMLGGVSEVYAVELAKTD